MKNNTIAHYWMAAALSGYATSKDWQDWADNIIKSTYSPSYWVIDVSLAGDQKELIKKLKNQLYEEQTIEGKLITISDSILGYYYLRFIDGNISFVDFLKLAGQEADSGFSDIDCEEIYSILNECEILIQEKKDISPLIDDVKAKFIKYAEIAKYQWNELQVINKLSSN